MSDAPEGHIITFYSYKGGTGRTMALANTAWILASNGKKVLVLDWDLESPGLHKFFHPFLDGNTIGATAGVIDMINEYSLATLRSEPRPGDWHLDYAKVQRNAVSIDWNDFPGEGTLDFISAGRQNRDYASLVAAFDWDNFYTRLGGGQFFDALRADMKRHYDYILLDSRTGLSDIADICTVHFPDTVVVCFTLSDQSIEGASAVAQHINTRYRSQNIRILPVPMRIDDGEKEKLDAGRDLAKRRFENFPQGMTADQLRHYWGAVEIPYKPFYAFEETLSAFGDAPGSPTSLLAAFERLVSMITQGEIVSMPPLPEELRLRVREEFVRRPAAVPADLLLSYVPEDRMWADWMASVLARAGFRVVQHNEGVPGTPPEKPAGKGQVFSHVIAVASAAYLRSAQMQSLWKPGGAADFKGGHAKLVSVRVADVRLAPPLGERATVDLTRLNEHQATEALLRVLGRPPRLAEDTASAPAGPRFPGIRPPVWNVPNRNAAFTGRNAVLERLRDQIVGSSKTVVLPQALYGLGGVGKTQVALEYAHRFMADYDVVWWVAAEHLELINPELAELAEQLGVRVSENVTEAAKAAREALRLGRPYSRWLLIFDNADDPRELESYLPSGSGHILITSRNPAWSRVADPLEVDVFTREESIEHLRRRVPGLARDDADKVASALGDLPLAIEQAGAWLEQTGMPPEQYVRLLDEQLTEMLKLAEQLGEQPTDYPTPVAATWNLSFERLRERSPASVRLLELLAFFGPEPVSLDMLYSDVMVTCLLPYDPRMREKLMLGPVIRQLGRYALARVDQADNSIQVHRLIQAVVRDRMNAQQKESTLHDVHRILVAARPQVGDTDDPVNWPRYNEIWPHLGPSAAADCDEEETRRLLIDRVRYLWKRGEFERSLALANTLEEKWNDKLGKDDPQTVHLRFHLANTLRSMGRYAEAHIVDTEVLTHQTRELGDTHPYTLSTAGGLAADLRALGNYQESLRIDSQTYERVKELFGEDHPRTLVAAHNLGVSLRLAGHFSRARDLDQETVDRRRQVIGEMHPYTLYTAANLARDLRELGQLAESVEMTRVNLEHYIQVLGDDLLDTLRTATSLAISLRRTGAELEARQLVEETHSRYIQRYGNGHPETLLCRLEYAACLSTTGEITAALDQAADVMRHFRDSLGPDHPYTLAAANNMAAYQRELGRLAEAKELAEATARSLGSRVGENHPLALAAAINLAGCLAELGELDAAESLERHTAADLREILGADHPDTLVCEADLAMTLNALGRTVEARQLRERVLHAMRNVLGDDHPHIADLAAWRRITRDLEPQLW
ncbi:FxSxx-COOH system tetratricopeptide repeat protein [Sphaerisporangium fuscum]|uniref:FxSxx-COOH system tetratricopeptide repeat protein n=1 Tax=Sphaerisporangium fuscum TaxID=2835868 RepID=UPI001BDC9C16|nr:FxSxx-COOH system tetratricopeptide repeat protein [Sphaerisporangium fuscum]